MSTLHKQCVKEAIGTECSRIEEDSLHSMKGHFNAGSRWQKVHLWIGLPSAILAGWSGIEAISNNAPLAAILALLSAALISTVTFLQPQVIAESHKSAGREYNELKNQVRVFREVDLQRFEDEQARESLRKFVEKRDALNSISPDIPRFAYNAAKKDIDEGRAVYAVDLDNGD